MYKDSVNFCASFEMAGLFSALLQFEIEQRFVFGTKTIKYKKGTQDFTHCNKFKIARQV